MRPVTPSDCRALDFVAALIAEDKHQNSVMPSTPGISLLASGQRVGAFQRWLREALQSGLQLTPQVVVQARKLRLGNRPVPILGIAERVVLRAVTSALLGDDFDLGRTQRDYLDFIHGPIDYVREKSKDRRFLRDLDDEDVQYVLKSDLSAFYQLIDHEVLAHLLVTRGTKTSLVEVLVNALGEILGHRFGLPQMYSAADDLSEVYAQRLQDQLQRRGYLVWRFNDDFRIAAKDWDQVIEAAEVLADEAGLLGLILNDHKTTGPKFSTYALDTLDMSSITDPIPEGEKDDVETAVAEYTDVSGDPDEAAQLLADLAVDKLENWDIHTLSNEQVGKLRRAMWTLAAHKDRRAMVAVTPLAIYVPTITPALARYLEAMTADEPDASRNTLSSVITKVSLGEWQKYWFLSVAYSSGMIDRASERATDSLLKFTMDCANQRSHPIVRAQASLNLAVSGHMPVADLAEALIAEPRAVAEWYVVGATAAASTMEDERVLNGIRGSDALHRLIIDSIRE